MPITTRSRTTGIVKRVKVADSVDFSDSVSSYAPKKRGSQIRKSKGAVSVDSEFELSGKDTFSDTHTVEESSVSDMPVKDFEVASSVDDLKSARPLAKKRKSRFRSKLTGTADSPMMVEKLHLFPEHLLDASTESVKDSILKQILERVDLVEMVTELCKEYNSKLDKRSEIVNRLLFNLKNKEVVEVHKFANSSFIGISHVKVKEYWDRLCSISRELLSKPITS